MRLTDDPDSIPIIPSSHEKADMLMAYSTVPGLYLSYPPRFSLLLVEGVGEGEMYTRVLEDQKLFGYISLEQLPTYVVRFLPLTGGHR